MDIWLEKGLATHVVVTFPQYSLTWGSTNRGYSQSVEPTELELQGERSGFESRSYDCTVNTPYHYTKRGGFTIRLIKLNLQGTFTSLFQGFGQGLSNVFMCSL